MTVVADVDLLDDAWLPPLVAEPLRLLVWAGPVVLGEISLGRIDPIERPYVRLRLLDAFADRLTRPVPASVDDPQAVDPADLSVVVCTRDRTALLEGALQHLLALDPPPGEILVVDNAPTSDATRQVVASAGVRYVVEPEAGLDRARNTGWRSAEGGVVVYTDDDARAHPRFAAAVAAGFLGAGVGAVTGLVVAAELMTAAQHRFEDLGGMRKGFERRVFQRDVHPIGLRPHLLGVGTNMAFRRDVLAELGGFDPRLDVGTPTRGGGDLDMLYRVFEAGWAVVYEPSAVVRHIHRRDFPGLRAQLRDNGVAYSAFLAKWEGEPATAAAARRARRQWHVRWHTAGLLGALRKRQLRRATYLVEEAWAARLGREALRAAGSHEPSAPIASTSTTPTDSSEFGDSVAGA